MYFFRRYHVIAYVGHNESEVNMAVDYNSLGRRIAHFRNQSGMSQEALSEKINVNFRHISNIETASKKPSLDAIVDIANALGVSADDLLMDSLEHHSSTADTELHRLLLDCNGLEEQIVTRMAKELKSILFSLGI